MTKEQLINSIKENLKNTPNGTCVVEFQNKLRNGRWGLHGFQLVVENDDFYALPWYGANVRWRVDLNKRLTKDEIFSIYNKVCQ